MDYTGILKRAWAVTWKYKILWLFGLFAGGSGIPSNTSSYRTEATWKPTVAQFNGKVDDIIRQLQPYLQLIFIGVVVLIVFSFVAYLVTVVARGALIHLVNEAEEGRSVAGGAGLQAAFGKVWRLWGVEFVTGLPMLVPVTMILAAMWFASERFFAIVRTATSWESVGMRLAQEVGFTVVGIAALAGVIAVVLGLMLAVVSALAMRYAVVDDMRVLDSIRQSWRDLWGNKGAFVMLLVMALVGIVFGIAMSAVGMVLMGPMMSISADGVVRMAPTAGTGLAFLLIVPAAAFSAFHSAAWTVFFRKMTGRVPLAADVPAPVPAPAPMGSDV